MATCGDNDVNITHDEREVDDSHKFFVARGDDDYGSSEELNTEEYKHMERLSCPVVDNDERPEHSEEVDNDDGRYEHSVQDLENRMRLDDRSEDYNDEIVDEKDDDAIAESVKYPHELGSSQQEKDIINQAMDEIIAKVNGMNTIVETPSVTTTVKAYVERPKRAMPKSMLNNQKKYTEHREKEERMLHMAKKKQKGRKQVSTKSDTKVVQKKVNNNEGKKRVLIGGKIRYIPIKTDDMLDDVDVDEKPVVTNVPSNLPVPEKVKLETKNSPETKRTEPEPKSVEKPETQREKTVSQREKQNSKQNKPHREGRKIPSKYAKPLEDEVKKYAVKNVRNFTDLRRVVSRENVKPDRDIDINSASIAELRKLRIEQRKRDQTESTERIANTKESAVQSILRDESLSKFAKAVKIKNLSVASRHQKTGTVPKKRIVSRAQVNSTSH